MSEVAEIPELAQGPRLYAARLYWRDVSSTPGGIATVVAAPSGARFVVMRPPLAKDVRGALEEVRLERIGRPDEVLTLTDSWGHPGGGPIDEPLLDLNDDLLVMPVGGDEAPDLTASDGTVAWMGKRVWVPGIDASGAFQRIEGRVTSRSIGAIVVDLDKPVTGMLDSSPVISSDGKTLVGIVSRTVKHGGETADTLLLTPSSAVWQRVTADEQRYPLSAVINAQSAGALDRFFYGWRPTMERTFYVRRVDQVSRRLTWARGSATVVAEAGEQDGLVLRVQKYSLEEVKAASKGGSRALSLQPSRELAVSVAGGLASPVADAREPWWPVATSARGAEKLEFALSPAWQWRAHVELLTGLHLSEHGKIALPARRAVSSPNELVMAHLTHRTACYPQSRDNDCARLVVYFRKQGGRASESTATMGPIPSVGGWLTQALARGALVREVLVTSIGTLYPVSVTSEGFLRTGEGELDIVHTLLEERSEPVKRAPCHEVVLERPELSADRVDKPPQQPIPLPENATPEYPRIALRAGIETATKASIIISSSGQVEEVCILDGHVWFDEPVVRALSTWRYEPARLGNGQPVTVKRVILIPFMLAE